jgi:hypothetical protein
VPGTAGRIGSFFPEIEHPLLRGVAEKWMWKAKPQEMLTFCKFGFKRCAAFKVRSAEEDNEMFDTVSAIHERISWWITWGFNA